MAIDTSCRGGVASLNGFSVEATVVSGLLVRMAGGATDFLWRGFVRGAFYVRMAIHTGKHAAVNRIFEGLGIDVKADGFAAFVVREGSIAMTREALIRRRFWGFFFGSSGERTRR